jgi:cytochrome c2
MSKIRRFHSHGYASLTALVALASLVAIFTLSASAQAPAAGSTAMPAGDADRGAEQFEATCAECHGPAATAPTLRGIIGREVASVESFYGYSEAMKAKKPMKWTKENIFAYLLAPPKFVPGNLMYREYPDPQLRADIIAFLETLPPPRQ